MTRRRRQHSRSGSEISIEDARSAIEQLVAVEGDETEIDPASQLFVEYAAPLLMTATNEQEFQSAVAIAEFVWMNSFYNATTQITKLQQFISDVGIPKEMVPWLMEVYTELALRKESLIG